MCVASGTNLIGGMESVREAMSSRAQCSGYSFLRTLKVLFFTLVFPLTMIIIS